VFAELRSLKGITESVELTRPQAPTGYVPISYNNYLELGIYSGELPTEFAEEPEDSDEPVAG
jgi:hypothetical protein